MNETVLGILFAFFILAFVFMPGVYNRRKAPKNHKDLHMIHMI